MTGHALSAGMAKTPLHAPALGRRLLCLAYEFCLLFGVTFVTGYLFLSLAQWRWPIGGARLVAFQAYEFVVIGAYFVYFWRHSGQTLAMKTWRIRLVAADGARPGLAQAVVRYMLLWWGLVPGVVVQAATQRPAAAASAFLGCTAVSILWMLVDPDRQFLHDRLLGTRLVAA